MSSLRPQKHGWLVLSLVLLASVVAADLVLGSDAVIGLFSIAPLVASLRLGPRRTAAVAVCAIAAGILVAVPTGLSGTVDHAVRVLLVASVGLLSVWLALVRERTHAATVQTSLVLDHIRDYAIYILDPEGRVATWNKGAEHIHGYSEEEVIGRHYSTFFSDGQAAGHLEEAGREGRHESEGWRVRRDGSRFFANAVITRLADETGLRGFSCVVRDATARRQADEERRLAQDRLAFVAESGQLLDASLDYEATLARLARLAVPRIADSAIVDLVEEDGTLRRVGLSDVSPERAELLAQLGDRYPAEPEGGAPWMEAIRTGEPVLIEELSDSFYLGLARDPEHLELLRGLGLRSAMFVPLRAHGKVLGSLIFGTGESDRVFTEADLGMAVDLATRCALAGHTARLYREAREAQARLAHDAMHDGLTGLSNRAHFLDRLELAFARAERRTGCPTVFFVDLDGFKGVNDTMGHAAGDELLKRVAARLGEVVRSEDTISRLGGDEFAIVSEEISEDGSAAHIADRIAQSLQEPFEIGGRHVVLGASIGIAFARRDDDTPDRLLRDADVAMYAAKRRGEGGYEIFDESMRPRSRSRSITEAALRHAVESDGFHLDYEPMFDVSRERLGAVEARIRWEHPTRGLLEASDFLPLAAKTGLIHTVGEFALETACRQIASWDDAELVVFMDLAPEQLDSHAFADALGQMLDQTGIDASRLCLSVSEDVLRDDRRSVLKAFLALRGQGVRLAIRGFGTQSTSLGLLRRLPVDYLKLDASYVEGLGRRDEDAAIFAAVVQLASALGMEVVAEGVETDLQLGTLRALGAGLTQGPRIGPAQSSEALSETIRHDGPWPSAAVT